LGKKDQVAEFQIQRRGGGAGKTENNCWRGWQEQGFCWAFQGKKGGETGKREPCGCKPGGERGEVHRATTERFGKGASAEKKLGVRPSQDKGKKKKPSGLTGGKVKLLPFESRNDVMAVEARSIHCVEKTKKGK